MRVALFFVLFAFPGRLVADELEPRLKHPWGACRPGASKEVRVVSENLDASGQVISRSTTVTRTTLQEVTARDYALAVKVCVDVGGKKFDSPPQLVRQGFYGEFPGEAVTLRKLRDETIAFQGRNLAVETREVTISGERQRRVMSVACSRAAYPFQFRCSASTFSGDGKTPLATTQVEVVATEIPYRVLGEIRDVAFVRTTQTHPKGTRTITLEVHCPDVPGGVVAHMSKEMDERGQTLRRSELELVAFDAGPVPATPRVLGATTPGEPPESFAGKELASDEATNRRPLRTRRREPAVPDRSPRR
ncbi:MAG: hypothetical protein ACKO38_16725 [Planctomycetota bacterium]